MIRLTCSACGHTMQAPDSKAGKTGSCRRCGYPVTVPAGATGVVNAMPPHAVSLPRMVSCPQCGRSIRVTLQEIADGIIFECAGCERRFRASDPAVENAADSHADEPASPTPTPVRAGVRFLLIAGITAATLLIGLLFGGLALLVTRSRPGSQTFFAPLANGASGSSGLAEDAPSDGPVKCGDVKLTLTPLVVGPWPWVPHGPLFTGKEFADALKRGDDLAPLVAAAGTSGSYSGENEQVLMIGIRNTSATRKIDYTSWGADEAFLSGNGPKLVDEFGNRYKLVRENLNLRPAFRTENAALGPNDAVVDILIFEPPIQTAKTLILELPQSAFGGRGSPARMRFSTSALKLK
jgi:hypothetical protein